MQQLPSQIHDTNKLKVSQLILGLSPTGQYDDYTKAAIKNFNLRLGKGPKEILDDDTFHALYTRSEYNSTTNIEDISLIANSNALEPEDPDITTDFIETEFAYETYMLDPDEYVTDRGKFPMKEYCFLHHTAGHANPYATIRDWNDDSRGRIGTEYVIGGTDFRTHNDEHDGLVVKCIPRDYFAWHLGSTTTHKINMHMHMNSIGIEICNMGFLTERNGNFFTWTGQRLDERYVEDLGFKFRGYQYWHKYTDLQIDSTYALLKTINREHNINIKKGLPAWLHTQEVISAFEFKTTARDGKVKGVLSHTNVRKDKTDISPQKGMIEMLKSL